MPPPLTLAFVPTLLRLGAPTISATSHSARPNNSTTLLPARRGLAFNDVPTRRSHGLGLPWKSPNAQRYRHSASAREKISHANKGNVPWNKGRKHSEETRAKISQATRAAMERPQVRDKLRRLATGRKHSEETKRKIRTTSRLNRSNGPQHLRIPRLPVPFTFDDATVALLDARITKRYRSEFTDKSSGVSARPKRPMSMETRRKLSERIRALWAEDQDYRDRVAQGIEERARKLGKSSLSEEHKEAISKSLRERHAKLRGEAGSSATDRKTTRKPRSKLNGPASGTRFDLNLMHEKDREALQERRRQASLVMDEAEAQEEATYEEELRIANLERCLAEKEAKRNRKKAEDAQKADRLLLESLASAGQLPSLEEECAMVGSSFLVGSSRQTEIPYTYLSMGEDLFLEDEEPLEDPLLDPLLVPPEFERLGL